jgi:uncharacterized DUF497 family protein/predicted RNase H-like HicB family nuclease
MKYAVVIEKAEGNFSAYVPDLPGCVATGATVEEVESEIRDAIGFHIEGSTTATFWVTVAAYVQSAYTSPMSSIQFEWDPKKAQLNLRKHRVSFEDAQSVFSDERALLIDDPDHSEEEDRFVLLGLSQSLRLLVVVHCYRAEGQVIRIISARKADAEEQSIYR